jgi:hypothetical protein
VNYQIHTDAIKENLIPAEITKQQSNFVHASEADLLNVALFGMTAIEQLVVPSNMESINGLLIRQGLPQNDRITQHNKVAITQMRSLLDNDHAAGRYLFFCTLDRVSGFQKLKRLFPLVFGKLFLLYLFGRHFFQSFTTVVFKSSGQAADQVHYLAFRPVQYFCRTFHQLPALDTVYAGTFCPSA